MIAARNEKSRIENTVRHLLAQRGAEIELIVVDDRSTDGTSGILQGLALADSRVRTVRIDALPEGWLGKCHACHQGAKLASENWILFTDADCWLRPDVIARAVRLAEDQGADHVTLSAGTRQRGFGLRPWYLLFLISLASWFSGVNRDRRKSYIGFGAFNLVRAAAYRECGGYEALRLTVLDDHRLGLLLRRAGKKTRSFLGGDDVECHWGTSLGDVVKIMEKNYFAVTDFRTGLALAGGAFSLLIACILIAGLASGTAVGLCAALSPFALVLPAMVLARRLGWPWPCALGTPLMLPVFLYALFNSTWMTLRKGGVQWRDTFYPLKTLRAGAVR